MSASPPSDAGAFETPDSSGPAEQSDAEVAPSPILFKSGSRLKIEQMRVDGESYFRRFVDTKLNTPCELVRTSETTALCVPLSAPTVYTNAACTELGALAVKCNPAIKYAVTFTNECGYTKNVVTYPLGAAVAGTTFYEKKTTCEGAPASEGDILSLGAPVPESELVTFNAQTERASAELGRTRWVASDGTEWVDAVAIVDLARAKPCQGAPLGLNSNTSRCVPSRRAVHRGGGDGPFTDDTCTTPVASFGFTSACFTPDIALVRTKNPDAGACNAFYFALAEVGSEVTSSHVLQGTCVPNTSTTGSTWSVGPSIPDTSYPTMEQSNFGAGRVRARAFGSNGVRLTNGGAFDTVAGGGCYEQKIGDRHYCVTAVGAADTNTFADASCTTPVLIGATTCSGPEPPQPQAALLSVDTADGCGTEVSEVHAVTLIAATQLYRKNGALCEAEAFSGKAYAVGAIVDPASLFPEVTIVTE